MRYLARNVALVLGTLALAYVIWQIREVAILFLLSLAVAAAIRPVIERLTQRGCPKTIALLMTYLAGIALVVGLVFLVSNTFLDELRHATDSLLEGYSRITTEWSTGSGLQHALAERLPPTDELTEALRGRRGAEFAQTAVGVTWDLFEYLIRLVLVIVLSMYWTLDRVHFERLWLSLVPGDRRVEIREIWQGVDTELGSYLRSEAVQSILAGAMLAIGYHILPIQYPTLLTIIGALAWLVPWIGAVLAVLPAFLVGLQGGPILAIGTATFALGVFLLLEFFVEPRFFNRRRYNALLAAVSGLALAELFGLVGLLLGPPLAVLVQIVSQHILRRSVLAVDFTHDIVSLEARLQELRDALEQVDPRPPELESMLDRLAAIVRDSRGALEQESASPAA